MKIRYRLTDEDREKYPGPDWLEFDVTLFLDRDVDFLEFFETTTGWSIPEFMAQVDRSSTRAMRALFWAGRRMAGCEDAWDSFKPKVWLAESEILPTEADTDPPVPANRAARRARSPRSPSQSRATASGS